MKLSLHIWKALIILMIGLILTVFVSYLIYVDEEKRTEKEFSLVCYEIKTKIETRLHAQAQLLRSGAAYFNASDTVTRINWSEFVKQSKIEINLPGIQGLGFSIIIPKSQLEQHIQRIRNEGFPQYTVNPTNDRSEYTSIIYLEPFDYRNQRAFGYDMFSQSVRREAMEQSRDFDIAALTGKVLLVQETDEDLQAGTLMYVPVYKNNEQVGNIQQRRDAIIGWVYSPYRMNDLMDGMLGSWGSDSNKIINLIVYDGDSINDNAMLFDSNKENNKTENSFSTNIVSLDFHGRKWTLYFTESNEQIKYSSKIAIVPFAGVVISFLISFLLFALQNTKKAKLMAEGLTVNLSAKNKELQKSKEKAEESENKFRTVFKQHNSVQLLIDPANGNIVDVNQAACDFYGYSYQELTSIKIEDINQYSKKLIKSEMQVAIDNERNYFEFKHKLSNGTVRNVEVYSNPIQIDDKKHLISIIHDITARKIAEKELIKAKEHAEESDRLKSAFLSNMSHEIRTPMNGILGFSSLLKQPGLKGEEQQKYIQIIEKAGARMLNIINDIVSISTIESGLMKVDLQESNINEQIEYIYTFFKPEVEAKGMELSFKNTLPSKEAIIKTDREKVFAILTNLVKNAIKYTNKGSIEFGYNKKEDYIEFFVKDTGIGIPKDRQEAIFERFIQADLEDKMARQGAGLGLAISKAYVEMLSGKIWVESQKGKGSIFYFTIPYNETFKKEIDFENIDVGDDSLNLNLKILIAEDDESSSQFLTIILDEYAKEIINVINGNEAVELCRNNPDIDLILLDIQMPDLNGYEATRQIREFNKEVVIIAQTAYGLSGDREKALDAGCNDYISKPINENELDALIQKYFNK